MRFKFRNVLYPLIALSAAALDLITKHLVQANMDLNESIPVIGDFLRFTYIYNKGITFGMFNQLSNPIIPTLLVILAIAALSAVVYLYINIAKTLKGEIPQILGRVSLMLIIGGALGNIIDRAINKAVVDFIDVGILKYRFFTFNVADSLVVAGGILLGILFILFENKKNLSNNEQ